MLSYTFNLFLFSFTKKEMKRFGIIHLIYIVSIRNTTVTKKSNHALKLPIKSAVLHYVANTMISVVSYVFIISATNNL